MAFYYGGNIQPMIPRVMKCWDEVVCGEQVKDADLSVLLKRLLEDRVVLASDSNKIVLLTDPDDARTVRLLAPIPNDLKSDTGQVVAFTQNQRYVSLERLKTAKTTIGLVTG